VTYEQIVISTYLSLGICFGWATFPNRHLFSEGPDKESQAQQASALKGRIFWTLICTWLWPIMVFTGINTAVILAKRKKLADSKT
jgi:Na+/proline symporter